jgi:predicted dehydrogenase
MDLNVGLVGHGRWGKRHLETLIRLKKEGRVQHITLCDRDPHQLADLSKQVDSTFIHVGAMLDAGVVNCIAVVTPPNSHLELASKALERNIPVLIEKPLSDRLEQEPEFLNSLTSEVTLVTGFLLRHHEGVEAMKQELDDGAIGTLQELHYRRRTKRGRPKGADAMKTLAIHGFDLSLFFGLKDIAKSSPDIFEHQLERMLLDAGGTGQKRLLVDVSWDADEELRELTLIGSKGNLSLTFGTTPEMHINRFGVLETVELTNALPPLYNEWVYFLQQVKSRTPTVYPPIQDLHALNQWFQDLEQY